MDATGRTEVMLRHAGVEPIGGELSGAAQELEALGWHDEVKESLLAADRAVALAYAIEARGDAKAHPSTVAAAIVRLHFGHCSRGGRRGDCSCICKTGRLPFWRLH